MITLSETTPAPAMSVKQNFAAAAAMTTDPKLVAMIESTLALALNLIQSDRDRRFAGCPWYC
jgi:hypothetical protein